MVWRAPSREPGGRVGCAALASLLPLRVKNGRCHLPVRMRAPYSTAMSQGNVEALREIFDRIAQGDVEFFWDSLDPEIEWDERDMPWLEAGVYRGVPELRDFLRRWLAPWARFEWVPRDFMGSGENVVVTVRQRGVGKGSGIDIDQTRSQIWTFRDGKVIRFRSFVKRNEALEAVGLSE